MGATATDSRRDAIALLLADLDDEGLERGTLILGTYIEQQDEGERFLHIGMLLRALIDTAIEIGTDHCGMTREELRDEFQAMAERLALKD